MLSKIAEHGGRPVDMTEYAMFFGFDVMGDIGMYSLIAQKAYFGISPILTLQRIFQRLPYARIGERAPGH